MPSSIRISLAVASASASHSHPAQITILAKGMIRAAARRKCKDIVEATLPRRWLLDRPVARSVRWLVGGFETGGIIIKYNTDFRRGLALGAESAARGSCGVISVPNGPCFVVKSFWGASILVRFPFGFVYVGPGGPAQAGYIFNRTYLSGRLMHPTRGGRPGGRVQVLVAG